MRSRLVRLFIYYLIVYLLFTCFFCLSIKISVKEKRMEITPIRRTPRDTSLVLEGILTNDLAQADLCGMQRSISVTGRLT